MSSADFKASPITPASSEFSQKTFSTQLDLKKLYLRSLPLSILFKSHRRNPIVCQLLYLWQFFSRDFITVCAVSFVLRKGLSSKLAIRKRVPNKSRIWSKNLLYQLKFHPTLSTDRAVMCFYKNIENPILLEQFWNKFLRLLLKFIMIYNLRIWNSYDTHGLGLSRL